MAGDDSAKRIASYALGEVDCDRSAGTELLGDTKVRVVEARVRSELVVGDDHADSFVAGEQRHEEAASRPNLARRLLMHLGILQDGIDALAPPAVKHAARLRTVAREHEAEHLGESFPGRSLYAQLVADWTRDRDDPRADELSETSRNEVEQTREIELTDEGVADLVQRFELT